MPLNCSDAYITYLSGWLGALTGDKRLLPIAAAQAQKAADFVLNTGHVPEEDAA